MPFQPNFLITNPLTLAPAEACALQAARNAYHYPYTRMKFSVGAGDIELAPGVRVEFDLTRRHQATDLSLDTYHRDLLRSHKSTDQLLGLASIIYWGFFTFNDNFARLRVARFLRGYRAMRGTTPALAARFVETALRRYDRNGHLGDVLSACYGISQLNRTPFASKVVAFLLPDSAGVYDNRLNRALSVREWSRDAAFVGAIGSVRAGNVRTGYHDWSCQLQRIAACLNGGIRGGNAWHWTSGERGRQLWRALDVERALFHLVA